MERFINRENLARFKRLLAETTNAAKRRQLEELIAEEEAKSPNPPKDD